MELGLSPLAGGRGPSWPKGTGAGRGGGFSRGMAGPFSPRSAELETACRWHQPKMQNRNTAVGSVVPVSESVPIFGMQHGCAVV